MINAELNKIRLPAVGSLRRDLINPLPKEQVENHQKGLIGEYDAHTIFYDIFLLDDGQTVVAMGPPLANLEAVLLPVTLHVQNRALKFKTKTRYRQLSVLTTKLSSNLPDNTPCSAQIEFANGLCRPVHLHPPTPMIGNTIVTHQKNHKIQWIKDWVDYYRNQFYTQNIVIYDNGSDNCDEVTAELEGIASVVPWSFPYGITDRSGNKFCQVGAINHLRTRYARNGFVFHFDMDELLILKTERAKRAICDNRQTRFNSFFVPYMPDLPENYSFADFTKRYRKPRNGAYKHAVRSDVRGIMGVHYFVREPRALYKLLSKKVSRGPILPVEDAYFLHYRGITTHWNKHYEGDRFAENENEANQLVEDRSVIDVFASLKSGST